MAESPEYETEKDLQNRVNTLEQILKRLDELSFLSRETTGAAFYIQHDKSNGKWRVVFSGAPLLSKGKLKSTDFDQALQDGIDWLKSERHPISQPEEKFTLYPRNP